MIILLLNFKRNKILFEHLTSDGKLTDIERNLLTNIVYKYKYNKLVLDKMSFRNLNTNNIVLDNNFNLKKLIVSNKLKTKNLNITNDISSNNLTVLNDLSANNFITNNIQSENALFNRINGEIFAENVISSELNTDKICIDSSCITAGQYNNIKKYFDPVNKYIYRANTPGKNDQNIIWNDLKDRLVNNNTAGSIRAVGPSVVMRLEWQTGDTYGRWPSVTWPVGTNKNGIPGAKNIYTHSKSQQYGILGEGIEITIPDKPQEMDGDITVLWVQVLAERINSFRVYEWDGSKILKDFGSHIVGATVTPTKIILNNISPDGAVNQLANNSNGSQYFTWWPVPIDLTGNTSRKLMISFHMDRMNDFNYNPNKNPTENPTGNPYISGFAFSKNPWNHCPVNHFSLLRRANNNYTSSYNHNIVYNNSKSFDYSHFANNTTTRFRIPYVYSGKDKVFYIIGCNILDSSSIISVTINNNFIKNNSGFLQNDKIKSTSVENGGFVTTLNNPFARHYNTKQYQRYIAIIIQKEMLIPDNNFIDVQITMGVFSDGFAFTEVGTHDLSP
jgi:hypothetical protein